MSSAWEGSHWRSIFLLLGDGGGVRVAAGQRVRVLTLAELGGPQPRYSFEAALWVPAVAGGKGGEGVWRAVGRQIEYPEAGLNCNDMADLLLQD